MREKIYIFFTFFLVLTGCVSGKKIVNKYYTIDIPADQIPVPIDSISIINGNCLIEKVIVNPVYAINQIVNRARSNEISYFIYHQWAIRPSEALSALMQEYFESARIFKNVSANQSWYIPDYRFGTFIRRLELLDSNKTFSAHLKLEFRVTDNSNDHVILSHNADKTIELKQNDLNIFALEVSKIICQELNIFSKMIIENRYLFTKDH